MLDFAARECPEAVLRSGYLSTDGESPSGKAAAFGAAIRRFESSLPSQAACAGNFPHPADPMRSLLTSPLPACYLAVRKSVR